MSGRQTAQDTSRPDRARPLPLCSHSPALVAEADILAPRLRLLERHLHIVVAVRVLLHVAQHDADQVVDAALDLLRRRLAPRRRTLVDQPVVRLLVLDLEKTAGCKSMIKTALSTHVDITNR